VLLVPVGANQQPVTAADEAWRVDFVTHLGSALGANVEPPVRSDSDDPPWASPAAVPPVLPLADATPAVAADTCASDICVIDNLTFQPDKATLVDHDSARRRVAAYVAAHPLGSGHTIRVTGFTAAFGDRDGSRMLSRERARMIARLLEEEGVPPESYLVDGVGFDRRADLSKGPQDRAQRVVILSIERRG
jgi:outer membrane protein OmpA-like peptidoglycan-associated protein